MGNCAGQQRVGPEGNMLEQGQVEGNHVSKLNGLILGTGGSGKSSLFRLLTREYGVRWNFGSCDVRYMLQLSLEQLLIHMITMEHSVHQDSGHKQILDKLEGGDGAIGADERREIANALEELWSTLQLQWPGPPGVTSRYWCNAPYLMGCVKRILRDPPEKYKMTNLDYVLVSSTTTGIYETSLEITIPGLECFQLKVFDVGGRRSERKKWVPCFADLALCFYVVDLSSYMHTLDEDEQTNGIHESLLLFKEIASSEWFADTHMVVIFNQYDIFASSVRLYPLPSKSFPGYRGNPASPDEVLHYIQRLYYNKLSEIITRQPCQQRKVFFLVSSLMPNPCLSYGSFPPINFNSSPLPRHIFSVDRPQRVALQSATSLPDAVVQLICEYHQSLIIFSEELGQALLARRRGKSIGVVDPRIAW